MPSVEGLGARQAALRILDAVLRKGQTLEAASSRLGGLAQQDRALAIAIAGEVFRRIPELDSLIDSATRQPLPPDSKARMVLRIALAQKIGLQTKDHALVATALPLVEGGPRRLVHGVLGTLLRKGVPQSDEARLPDDVEDRWRSSFDETAVEAARRLIVRRAPLDLSFADDGEAQLYSQEIGARSLASFNVRVESTIVSGLAGFEEGRWWVQDLAASLPARLIKDKADEVLDLCAAPGGKTMQLSSAKHHVTSVDWSKSCLGRLGENLLRTHLHADLIEADALEWEPDKMFDAILLDAPCSATGTFRRHPEVLFRAGPTIIAQSAKLQRELLSRASKWLKPKGELVYSVCSLEIEEGEEMILQFLASNPQFKIDPPGSHELPEFVPIAPEGWVRILPGLLEEFGGLDGFFMARLVRSA